MSFKGVFNLKKYYLGELHGRNGEKDKIYYNWVLEKFIALKQDGTERNLSEKQKEYLYKKFHKKCKLFTLIGVLKFELISAIIGIGITYTIKYRNILEDLPKLEKEYCFDEMILHEERDIDFLVSMCNKYIDKNESYTNEQKEYLKLKWSQYLEDEGELFERNAILDMLQNLSSVPIEYKDYENNHVLGRHRNSPHKIILYTPYATNANLAHETEHCVIGDNLSFEFLDSEEGYCGAFGGKYCDDLTYPNENEYLLIMSEIIGKEKLKWCIINGKEDELIKELANKTHTSKKEISDLIAKTYEYNLLFYDKDKTQERKNLNREIKRELAELAIKADESNKDNFIVLNAYYNKYDLDTSFLEDRYLFIAKEETDIFTKYMYISDENKYNYILLFEDELTRTKSKNK